MKILVTGARGQLGLKIKELMGSKYNLILTDKEDLDITNKQKVDKYINQLKPDLIIHTAAFTQVDNAEASKELCKKINSIGTKNIAQIAQKINAIVIYISTDYVFDGKKNKPYIETDTTNPISIYGKTKYEGEKYIQKYLSKYYIIRSAWIFGELPKNKKSTNFVDKMISLSRQKQQLSIVSDQIGSPTYTANLVKIIEKIITAQIPYGIYHYSGQGECSWFDFAQEIFKQKNIKIMVKSIKTNEYPQKAKRPKYSYLSKNKIEKALKIKTPKWQKMLSDYLN